MIQPQMNTDFIHGFKIKSVFMRENPWLKYCYDKTYLL
jgi:hypothetical protein